MKIRRSFGALPLTTSIIDHLILFLGSPEEQAIDKIMKDLVRRNIVFGGNSHGYYLHGERFDLSSREKYPILEIHESLVPEAESLRRRKNELTAVMQLLRQGLGMVLGACHSDQDIRNVLPETLIRALPAYQAMDRTEPEGFVLRDDSRRFQQFQRIVDITLKYTARRLLD